MKKIENFRFIESGYVYNTPNNVQFFIERVGHDVNGNPKYKLKMYDYIEAQKIKVAKNRGGRFYDNGRFLIFTSYNLPNTIEQIFKKANINSGLK